MTVQKVLKKLAPPPQKKREENENARSSGADERGNLDGGINVKGTEATPERWQEQLSAARVIKG